VLGLAVMTGWIIVKSRKRLHHRNYESFFCKESIIRESVSFGEIFPVPMIRGWEEKSRPLALVFKTPLAAPIIGMVTKLFGPGQNINAIFPRIELVLVRRKSCDVTQNNASEFDRMELPSSRPPTDNGTVPCQVYFRLR